ncbi:MAG: helix-turn-helix domain-containing protein [Candidatus Odinarchaeum yellowstonii]|uniref:Helix-turn-helix domain-containing protein n=1 Tax=Odinarchaeota yellowstonii (strain LCB_4) TaxID=1841599 RepID=A0AAF0D1M7_ODILC|nr:MAG: helix-turn-helix domain-containing protein [Candidatus Odinarchaeum yellowstonii]
MPSEAKILKDLKKFGLTPNQAKIYLTLIQQGGLTAKQVSVLSGVPESKVYDLLHQLEENKWVEVESSRPVKFTAKPPSDVIKTLKNKKIIELDALEKALIEELEPIYLKKSQAEKPDIWILRGEERLLFKLKDMISKAEKNILIALPVLLPGLQEILFPVIQTAKLKGIKTVIVIPKTEADKIVDKIKTVSDVITVDQLFGGGVIVDQREVLIILYEPLLGIWSDHAGLAQVAAGYFNYSWGKKAGEQ